QLVRSAVRASGAAATTAAPAVTVSGAGDAPAIRAPLPGVARHVVKTEAVGAEGVDRARARETVLARVVAGEGPLPHVAAVLAIRCQLVAPREGVLLEAAPGRVLPLGLRRQALPYPVGVGDGIVPRHVHHRVVGARAHVRAGSLRPAPGRAVHGAPPR